ncbi:YjbQ family protein [bacterium]|nr:MAG: YjbQ family protein [bacterium]
MRQEGHEFSLSTQGVGAIEFTDEVCLWVGESGIANGLLTLHVRHTSASLVIMENADPTVMEDLQRFFDRLTPHGDPLYHHTAEGPDDMPAHVRTALTMSSLSIPVVDGRPTLGTWQGIWLLEHRTRPHQRRVAAHLMGE